MIQVLPRNTVNGIPHCRVGDSMLVSDSRVGFFKDQNSVATFTDKRNSQDRIRAILSAWKNAFLRAILHVVFIRPEKEMGWIHTERVVAVRAIVANKQPMRNRTIVQYPRIAMGSCLKKASIAPVGAANPEPAGFGFVDPSPERRLIVSVARSGTEMLRAFLKIGGFAVDSLAADNTLNLHLKLFLSGVCGAWSDFRASLPIYPISQKEAMCL